MNEQIRTLGQVISEGSQQGQGQLSDQDLLTFSTYLNVFSIQLAHRFPDVSDINTIDYNMVSSLAKFSYACSKVAVTTWNEVTPLTVQRRQKLQRSA